MVGVTLASLGTNDKIVDEALGRTNETAKGYRIRDIKAKEELQGPRVVTTHATRLGSSSAFCIRDPW